MPCRPFVNPRAEHPNNWFRHDSGRHRLARSRDSSPLVASVWPPLVNLRKYALFKIVLEVFHAVAFDPKGRCGPEYSLGNGVIRIIDIRGHDCDFEVTFFEGFDQSGKFLFNLFWLDVATLADRCLNAIESQFGDAIGKFVE